MGLPVREPRPVPQSRRRVSATASAPQVGNCPLVTSACEERTATRDVAITVALAVLAFVPSMFTRDPWNPDEPRYTEVAREMVVTGNYAVPRLNGEIYPDKPAPFFWMVALLMRLGFGFASGRVVAAVASTGTLLLVYHLGRRLYGREVGLLAALVTLTPGPFAERFGADRETLARMRELLTPARIVAALALAAARIAGILYASATLGDLRQERRRAWLAVAAALAVSLVGDLVATPLLDHFKSGRDLVDRGKAILEAADEVHLLGSDYSGVYNLFSGRIHMPLAKDAKALKAALAQGRRIAVIAREQHIEHLPSLPFHVAVRERVGSKKMIILTNWQPDQPGVDPNREGGPQREPVERWVPSSPSPSPSLCSAPPRRRSARRPATPRRTPSSTRSTSGSRTRPRTRTPRRSSATPMPCSGRCRA